MNNITFKNQKSISKIFKQPFRWIILTVSNENGYHKIALKKNLFKKTYTVSFVKDGKIYTKKTEVSIKDLSNQNISIEELGNLHIEDINLNLKDPSKIIENEEKIYSAIDTKARKEEQNFFTKKIELDRQSREKKEKENERSKRRENYYRKEDLIAMRSHLIEASERTEYSHKYGYNPGGSGGNSIVSYGLGFVIKELENIAQKIGFKGFENNGLHTTLKNLKEHELKCYSESETFESDMNILYVFNGLLAQELMMRTIELCNYVRQNDIDTKKFIYYEFSSWCNPLDCYQQGSSTIKIYNEFDELINAVSKYVENVTGVNITNQIQTTLQKQYLKVI